LKYEAKNLGQNSKKSIVYKDNKNSLKAPCTVIYKTVKEGKKTIIVKNLILPAVEDMTRYGLDKKSTIYIHTHTHTAYWFPFTLCPTTYIK
jgi:S-adenosylmethionine synthetase